MKDEHVKLIKELIWVIIIYTVVYMMLNMMGLILGDMIKSVIWVMINLLFNTPIRIKLTSILIIVLFLLWYHKDKWWR